MTISIEKLPDCKARVSAEFPPAEVTRERDQIVSLYARQAKLPGFRQGKAPRAAVEKRYQKEIGGELGDRLVSRAFREAGQEHQIDILAVAEEETRTFGPDGGFAWAAQVVVAPEFVMPGYEGIPVEVPKIRVEDEQIDRVIERMRVNFSELIDKEGPLEPGDIAVMAWTATTEGRPLEEAIGKTDGYWVPIPAEGQEERFLPNFTPQVIGMRKGESRDVTVTMPENFQPESLQGRTLDFAVTMQEVKARQLPPLDDELGGKISEGKTLAEAREEIRKGLEAEHERMRENLITNQILAHLNGNLEFDLPQHLLFNETQRQVNDMVYESYQRGANEDLIREHQGEILESAQSRAKMNLKTTFILEKIAEAEKIATSDQEVSGRVIWLAEQSGKPLKKVLRELQDTNGYARIRHDLTIAKVLAFLRTKTTVTEVDAPAEPMEAALPAGTEN